jgi:hypothetical protein
VDEGTWDVSVVTTPADGPARANVWLPGNATILDEEFFGYMGGPGGSPSHLVDPSGETVEDDFVFGGGPGGWTGGLPAEHVEGPCAIRPRVASRNRSTWIRRSWSAPTSP